MTAYNLSPGKSWVTGESVTATKMNTALTGSTTTITNNLIGQASSTTDNIPQWSDTTGALLKDGKIFTTDVDSGSLDTEVPSAKACYNAVATITATSSTNYIDVGTKRIAFYNGVTETAGVPGTQNIAISGFSGTPDFVTVSTRNSAGSTSYDTVFQVVSWTSTNVIVIAQAMTGSAFSVIPTITVFGTPA